MDVFELTRALIDIDSVTPNEGEIGDYLYKYMSPFVSAYEGQCEKIPVTEGRNNVYAAWGSPEVVFSTHMDTVPPFIASSEDDEFIWGRGAADTHGIAAAMLKAVETLLKTGERNLGVLFVVGEEVDGIGAEMANSSPPQVRYLINGEPTQNCLGLGTKGALRIELQAKGRSAHSAYPELGESAIEKLIDNLASLRRVVLPDDETLGPSTLNIGTISGGKAANVIPDLAQASVVVRVVSDINELKKIILAAFDERVSVRFTSECPAVHLKSLPGFETCIVKYATDIPKLTNWGEPLLIGPGNIHVAHTLEERVEKKQLVEASQIYCEVFKQLQTMG